MIAVIFEVWPHAEHRQDYFDIAASLRPEVAKRFLEQLRGSGIELAVDQTAAVRADRSAWVHHVR